MPPDKNETIHQSPVEGKNTEDYNKISEEPYFDIGEVVSIIPGSGITVVRFHKDKPEINCINLSSALSDNFYYTGISEVSLPHVGSTVLVCINPDNSGCILGSVPAILNTKYKDSETKYGLTPINYETNVGMFTDAYSKNSQPALAHNNRPDDLIPGDYALYNEFGVSLALYKFMLGLKASERAKLEMFLTDDMVRLTTGQFQHDSAAWNKIIENDGGFNTEIIMGSQHYCEMLGSKDYKPIVTDDSFKEADLETNKHSALKLIDDKIQSRDRYRIFLGHLGGIFNAFILNPDPNEEKITYDTESKDQGLFHMGIDNSGRLNIKSANSITLQRKDIIPVPKRLKEAWDPEGNKLENTPEIIKKKEPFINDSDHPDGKHLHLRDKLAWETKQVYQRYFEQDKDWYVPNESEIDVPDDIYERVDGVEYGEAKYQDNRHKNSIINMDDDGGITIRDAHGSEIVMRGGNITITAPGNIYLRSGQDTIILAGKDNIVKAKKNIDITATEEDIRIKSEKNMEMCSNSAGILLESKADSEVVNFDSKGLLTKLSGIILKSKKGNIFASAPNIHFSFISNFIIESLNNTGTIITLAKNIYNYVNVFMTSVDKTVLYLTKAAGMFVSPSIKIAGENEGSVQVTEADKIWAISQKGKTDTSVYSDVSDSFSSQWEENWNDGEPEPGNPTFINSAYLSDNKDKIGFTFRKISEYGLSSDFKFYDTNWSTMLRSNSYVLSQSGYSIDYWKEKPLNDIDEEEYKYPWPGSLYYTEEKKAYYYIDKEGNVDGVTGNLNNFYSEDDKNIITNVIKDEAEFKEANFNKMCITKIT